VRIIAWPLENSLMPRMSQQRNNTTTAAAALFSSIDWLLGTLSSNFSTDA